MRPQFQEGPVLKCRNRESSGERTGQAAEGSERNSRQRVRNRCRSDVSGRRRAGILCPMNARSVKCVSPLWAWI